ncbi:MAG: hexokinase [Treponema sp.]|jgi:hexokinase|nr:hexokinase [Treponema sp.]
MSKFDPNAISEFARYYGFHYDRIDPIDLVEDVVIEMKRGLAGQSSSMLMIPTYISPVARATPGKTVIALDAGGTNLRAALVKFDENGKAVESESVKAAMPGTYGRVSAETFFDRIADVTVPLIEKPAEPIQGIGFCFSYSMEITKEADGILISFSKEVDVPEVIGKAIGQGLKDALARRKAKVPERIVLLNDTAATLLSGLSEIPGHGGLLRGEDRYGVPAGPMIGFILGTGFNTAYPESQIPKIDFESADNPQIVVCESGNFAHRYMGPLDKEYDKTTNCPGGYTLEKAAAGAYLGPLSLHIFKQAVRDGILKFKKSEELLSWPTLQTRDLNAFMHAPLAMEGPVAALFDKDEIDAVKTFAFITSIVTERGAQLSAAVVAGAVERTNAGHDPFVPVRIAVEGTTFMIYKGMRRALESWFHLMLNKGKPRSYSITPVEQASLLGAAVAALSK